MLTPLKLRHAADTAAADLPALLAEAEKAAEGILSGEHRLRKPGQGESFWQFRDYEPQDRPQDIDWRQSAKGDRVFIRQKEKQTPQPVSLWCAGGPSMDYTSRRNSLTKATQAAIMTLALSLLLTKRGEHVSLLGGLRNPGRSEYTLTRLGEQLIDNLQNGRSLPAADAGTFIPSGHTAILTGDFLSPLPEIEDALRQLNTNAGTGFIIQVLDPAELELPFSGRIIFRDPLTDKRIPIENAADVSKAYNNRINTHLSLLRQLCREMDYGYYLHLTDQSLTNSLSEIWDLVSPSLQTAWRPVQ